MPDDKNYEDIKILISPEKIQEFQKLINATSISYSIHIDDVGNLIDQTNPTSSFFDLKNFNWTTYHDLNAINSWLDLLEQLYPNNVKVINGGKSHEGRNIKGVKLSFKKGNPGIFLEGGIHACEWISPATVTYLIYQLLTNENPDVRELAESNDWYIFPVINPDGYVYSHTTVL